MLLGHIACIECKDVACCYRFSMVSVCIRWVPRPPGKAAILGWCPLRCGLSSKFIQLLVYCDCNVCGRFLYEEGSPANQYYKKCLLEMQAEVALRDAGTEADTEDADGEGCF